VRDDQRDTDDAKQQTRHLAPRDLLTQQRCHCGDEALLRCLAAVAKSRHND
jgi:hypothetical protein